MPTFTEKIRYRSRQIGDVEVFYREAGPVDAPVVLLLHGFPTASHMFRDLMPLLADRYRLIAPDLPGFGQTKAPPRGIFDYSFDRLAEVIEGFTEALSLDRYALYIFDYGAPVGLRLAMRHPDRVSAIISQNGNAYTDGFSDQWGPWEDYWREGSDANREACRPSLSPETIRNWQYGTGADPELLSPDGYELDIAYMARPGAEDIQLDLIRDYRTNVALYPGPSRKPLSRGSPARLMLSCAMVAAWVSLAFSPPPGRRRQARLPRPPDSRWSRRRWVSRSGPPTARKPARGHLRLRRRRPRAAFRLARGG